MLNINTNNIHLFNENLRYESPSEIVSFILKLAKKPIVSTSFGTYSAAVLFTTSKIKNNINIIWCDTGFNTQATYNHADLLIKKWNLNIEIFKPTFIPETIYKNKEQYGVNSNEHLFFSEKVKLEPFKRALNKYKPDVWITNIRKSQTQHRNSLDILTFNKEGILKVAPFFYFSDEEMKQYFNKHKLPMEEDYFDPVKAAENRECGIHLNK